MECEVHGQCGHSGFSITFSRNIWVADCASFVAFLFCGLNKNTVGTRIQHHNLSISSSLSHPLNSVCYCKLLPTFLHWQQDQKQYYEVDFKLYISVLKNWQYIKQTENILSFHSFQHLLLTTAPFLHPAPCCMSEDLNLHTFLKPPLIS